MMKLTSCLSGLTSQMCIMLNGSNICHIYKEKHIGYEQNYDTKSTNTIFYNNIIQYD